MVQLSSNAPINLESVLEISQETSNKIKKFSGEVEQMQKDLNIKVLVSTTEGGTILSTAGRLYKKGNVVEESTDVEKCHIKFLQAVYELPDEEAEKSDEETEKSDDVTLVMTRKGHKIEIEGNMALQEAIFHLSHAMIKLAK